jgi:hypothetical protein
VDECSASGTVNQVERLNLRYANCSCRCGAWPIIESRTLLDDSIVWSHYELSVKILPSLSPSSFVCSCLCCPLVEVRPIDPIADTGTTLNCITRNGRVCLESHPRFFGGVDEPLERPATRIPWKRYPRRLFSFSASLGISMYDIQQKMFHGNCVPKQVSPTLRVEATVELSYQIRKSDTGVVHIAWTGSKQSNAGQQLNIVFRPQQI